MAPCPAHRGFLPNEDLPWAEEYRQRLGEIHIAALESYAAVPLGVGGSELAPGERAARELIKLAPYRERGHALLMEILTARGNSAEALRVYEQLRQRSATSLAPHPRSSFASSNSGCFSGEPGSCSRSTPPRQQAHRSPSRRASAGTLPRAPRTRRLQ